MGFDTIHDKGKGLSSEHYSHQSERAWGSHGGRHPGSVLSDPPPRARLFREWNNNQRGILAYGNAGQDRLRGQ